MKLLQSTSIKMYLFVMLTFSALITFAQEQSGEATTTGSSSTKITTSTSTSETWYAQPWVWVVGGAVLLLLLVALLRGGSSSGRTDRVTVTKTVDRDTV